MKPDLATITHERFEACLHQTFQARLDAGEVPMELIRVSPIGKPEPGYRQAFSLLFRAPKSSTLPQRIYPLQHPTLGHLDIFLVPIGPDQEGLQYEAVFA